MIQLDLQHQIQIEATSDIELILRAYLVWGEDCVQHLIGDFSFIIWNRKTHQLFGARDQIGVKLFYYARVRNSFVISNVLTVIRQHPWVTTQLNDAAIADFLLFDFNQNSETTVFRDIQRLPPAHTFTYHINSQQIRRYWTLPVPPLIRYRQSQEYIEHFQELMQVAVSDRLRTDKVAISLSGGLDSSTLAAMALEVAASRHQALDLQAFTGVYDHLFPDQERYYAGQVAQALNIPIHYQAADHYTLYQSWEQPHLQTPEPCNHPLRIHTIELLQQASKHSRVMLQGQAGDEVFRTTTVARLLGKMPLPHLLQDIGRCIFEHHLTPPWGSGLLHRLRSFRQQPAPLANFPHWLNPAFCDRYNLRDRWQAIHQMQPLTNPNVLRSDAYAGIMSPSWVCLFEFYDPGSLQLPIENRYPFLDLRLINYLLAVPPFPWHVNKYLLRIGGGHNRLPSEILQRPKTGLAGDPIALRVQQGQNPWQDLENLVEVRAYVDVQVLLNSLEGIQDQPILIYEAQRPISLGYWLRQLSSLP